MGAKPYSLLLLSNGNLAVGSEDRLIRIFNLNSASTSPIKVLTVDFHTVLVKWPMHRWVLCVPRRLGRR